MMYGFGDVKEPRDESVQVLQEIALEYIDGMSLLASSISTDTTLKAEDIVFAIRKDQKKFGRAVELLAADQNIKATRKQFAAPFK